MKGDFTQAAWSGVVKTECMWRAVIVHQELHIYNVGNIIVVYSHEGRLHSRNVEWNYGRAIIEASRSYKLM